jgi:hypothetical protein
MADYSQMKVPDLKKILQERGLVVSGNKADLIARLQEDDKKAGGTTGKSSSPMRKAQMLITFLQVPLKMRLTGTKTTTRQQHPSQRQNPQQPPLQPEAKDPLIHPSRSPIKKSTSIPLQRLI